jgi:hypothetical protein
MFRMARCVKPKPTPQLLAIEELGTSEELRPFRAKCALIPRQTERIPG